MLTDLIETLKKYIQNGGYELTSNNSVFHKLTLVIYSKTSNFEGQAAVGSYLMITNSNTRLLSS